MADELLDSKQERHPSREVNLLTDDERTPTPGQAAHDAFFAAFGGPDVPDWPPLGPAGTREGWEAAAQAAIKVGGWDALAADIEALKPGEGITIASTLLAQVARAVVARLTGLRPQGDVKVDIDSDDEDGARVTIGWGSKREAAP